MAWIYLVGAGLSEIAWATMMKYTEGFTKPLLTGLTIAAMIVSFQLLALALKELPMSTAYAVWVGIGAVGVAVIGMAFLGESATPPKILFLAMIVVGIVGLKLVT